MIALGVGEWLGAKILKNGEVEIYPPFFIVHKHFVH